MPMPIRVRDDHLTYRSWRVWRARQARLPVTVEVRACGWCVGQGWIYEAVRARAAHDMSVPDYDRPPHLLPVVCGTCGGRKVTETVVDVEAA